uniref:PI31 proteasome regulator N-terminal domain-containing protein n=1 Tax=Araucaria cunninghamii TaxID=56994 RepID=A0A0D6R5R3_ARACU
MATDAVLAVIRASRPSFRNPHDKIAFAVHACFLAAGYSLTATGSQAEEASQPSSSGNEEVGIEGWNQLEDSYAFCYIKSEKGETKYVIVKCLVMGDLLIVDAVLLGAKGNPEPYNLEINVKDYTNESAVRNNYAGQYKDFPSLVEKINSGIVSRLENFLEKGSASANSRLSVTSGEVQGSAESQPGFGVSVHQPDSSGLLYPPVPTVGGSDVFPGPGAGIYPRRGGNGMGGGMLLGPNDPRWGNIGIAGDEGPFFRGEVRGVPPGARFEPFGPPGVPGFEPNRFIRDQRRPPGRGTHPDLEHFSPY